MNLELVCAVLMQSYTPVCPCDMALAMVTVMWKIFAAATLVCTESMCKLKSEYLLGYEGHDKQS